MTKRSRVLIACSRLFDMAGAEVTCLELAEAFIGMGWEVSIGAYELSLPLQLRIEQFSIKYFNLANSDEFLSGHYFDVAWLHHSVAAYRVLLDPAVTAKKAIFSSLSHFEPIESPPNTSLRISKYLVNSGENFECFKKRYPGLVSSTSVFHNSSPKRFWEAGQRASEKKYLALQRIAVVSNHVPEEVFAACRLLEARGVLFDVFGLQGKSEWITPELLSQYDAVITIGKTVQYCISCKIPVYCYDHFGGNGWLLPQNFNNERYYNFSGRGGRGKVSSLTIANELMEGFSESTRQVSELYDIGKKYFSLEDNIDNLLSDLEFDFFLDQISIDDVNIILQQGHNYIKQREIIKNLDLFLLDCRNKIACLEQTAAKKDLDILRGERLLLEYKNILIDKDREMAKLANSIDIINSKLDEFSGRNRKFEMEISSFERILLEKDECIAELKKLDEIRKGEIIDLVGRGDKYKAELTIKEGELAELRALLNSSDRRLNKLNQEIQEITNSNSWVLTGPLRVLGACLRFMVRELNVKISWCAFLLSRSRAVIRYQGFGVFLVRVKRYLDGFARRKLAEFKNTGARSLPSLTSFAVDEGVLVTFVIPIYDRTDVLRLAIKSALLQSINNIEVILITDGSPAETVNVVNEFADDPRVRIFLYPKSSGNAVRGRNKGILEARGKYIAFLDSDDIAVLDRLKLCLPNLESGQADVVYGAWRAIVDGSRNILGIDDGQVVFSPDADLSTLVENCVPCQSTVIVRKSFFDLAGFLKPSMKYREDHELWARLAYHGAIFKSIPQVLVELRLHDGNNEINFKHGDSHWAEMVRCEYAKPGPKPKKIAFVLPGVGISGGIAVVFKHAALLLEAGHDVFVINVGDVGDGSWFTNNPVPIVHIGDRRRYIFDNIDLLFATGWSTVEWLDRISSRRKLYFVQSDERRFFDDKALKLKIHNTYLTPFEYLTEAHWIRRMLKEEFSHEAAYVPNGIDTNIFFPRTPIEPKRPGKVRVLLEGPIVIPFKGMADSYAAVEGLDCEIWIVSSAGRPPDEWRYDRFFEGVAFGEMAEIYSSCDIFLKMSRVEGFFGPPMEAMACGCAVVVGKVTGYDEYIAHNENALVVDQGDVSGAHLAVESLIKDEKLRLRLVDGGFSTVKEWGWEKSAAAMLSLVND